MAQPTHNQVTMTASPDDNGRDSLTAASWWTVDRSQEPPLQVGATPLVEKCMKLHGWSHDFSLQVLEAYQRFLNFKNIFQDHDAKKFHPPIPVDHMWKIHIQDAANYELDCQLLFGRMMHRHSDALDAETRIRRIERTLYVLRLQCKDDFDRTVWDFGVDTGEKKRGLRPRTNRVDWSKKIETDSTPKLSFATKTRKNDSEENRKRRRTPDGCLLPAREPKQNADGTYGKPVGRVPQGMAWDVRRGLFAPIAEGTSKVPKKALMLATPTGSAPKSRSDSVEDRKKRKTDDGCLRPAREPKRNADGTYVRPCGRVPSGMAWDEARGVFAPIGGIAASEIPSDAEPVPESKLPRAMPNKTYRSDVPRKGRATQDGCFRPASKPRQAEDGTFVRPVGRGPSGMVWNAFLGLFVPLNNQTKQSVRSSVPCVTPNPTIDTSEGDLFNGLWLEVTNGEDDLVPRNLAHEEATG